MTAHLRTDGAFVHWVIVSPLFPFPPLLSTPPQTTPGRVNCHGLRAKFWRKQKQEQIQKVFIYAHRQDQAVGIYYILLIKTE
jgi:hypothetical protein